MNIEWDYNYYQPWSDNEWLVDEMLAMLDEDIYHKWLLTWFVIWEKSSSREFKQGLDNNKRCC